MALTSYLLGDRLQLDAGRRELLCAGEAVELKRKAVEVLCVLAEAGGELVTKEELLSRIWPHQIVEENNLQVHVSALRKVLARHAGGYVHLVTVPREGYRLLGTREGFATAGFEAATQAGPVVAVLPFGNPGAQGDPDPLAQGMAEEISIALSRARWLSVIGAASTVHVHARDADPRSVARSLHADYLVQGYLRRQADRVRVTAQLSVAQSLTNVWSERYDRHAGDVFALQDEIAASVACAIEPKVQQAELDRIRRKHPADLQAYECVLEAAALLRTLMPDGARRALTLLAEALRRDPGYAWAQALQAWCRHVLYSRGGLQSAHCEAAVAGARSALAAGCDDAQVVATCGFVLWFDAHETAVAFELFDRALGLSPSNFLALAASSVALAWSGVPRTAAERAQLALRLNPFHPLKYLAWQGLAGACFQQGDAGGAAVAAARAVEANPGFSVPLAYLCAAQSRAGDSAAARETAAQLLRAQPGFCISRFRVTVGVNPAVFDAFAQEWREAGLPE